MNGVEIQSGKPRRLLELDVLRCFAVVVVVIHHTWELNVPDDRYGYFGAWVPVIRAGWIGVPVFFVISGFLISNMLLREYLQNKQIRVKRFLARRAFKIYPAFYACITLYAGYLIVAEGGLDAERLLRELFFLQNYGKGGLIDVSWSLAVEEHFYLLFPVVLLVLVYFGKRSGKSMIDVFRPLVYLSLFLVLVCLLLRMRAFNNGADQRLFLLLGTHLRIDALFVGASLAYAYVFYFKSFEGFFKKLGWPAVVICLFALAPAMIKPGVELDYFIKTYYLILLSLVSAMVLGVLLSKRLPETQFIKVCAYLGRHSYCIYLFHLPFIRLTNKIVPHLSGMPSASVLIGVCLLGACVIGIVVTHLIEWPMLKLRDRFFPASITSYFFTNSAGGGNCGKS